MAYQGSVELISGIAPKNNGTFPLVDAKDVRIDDSTRLDACITGINNKIGAANGIASLDSSGKVPSSQLPSYVDDVVEYATRSAFPVTGEAGKIYVDLNTNKTYRWGGSEYVAISSDIALGETHSSAYYGDYGKVAYDHAIAKGSALVTSALYKITTNSEGHVTAGTEVPVATTAETQAVISGGTVESTKLMDLGDGKTLYDDLKTRIGNVDPTSIIDDTAGDGDTDKVWSADKLADGFALKADAENPVFIGSISMGRNEFTVPGLNSVATGDNVEASGTDSHAEGKDTTASGGFSHAEGDGATASGNRSHAEGAGTVASGIGSHAEGQGTVAFGAFAHAQGYYTIASDQNSSSGGALNLPTKIGNLPQWTAYKDYVQTRDIVKYNGNAYACKATHISGSEFDATKWILLTLAEIQSLEIIGNGTSNNARSNARMLDKNGNEYLKGDLYVGCNANSSGGSKVINEAIALSGVYEYTPATTATFTYGRVYHEVGTDRLHMLNDDYRGTVFPIRSPGEMDIETSGSLYHLPETNDSDWNVYSMVSLIDSKAPVAQPIFSTSITIGSTTLTEAALQSLLSFEPAAGRAF